MDAFLSTLPIWPLFVIMVGGFVALSCGTTLLMYRRKPPPVDKRHNELVSFFFATVGVIYAVIIAFLVISVWEQYNTAELAVSQEAAAIVSVARDTITFPEPIRSEAREQLRDYAEEVVNNEWRLMSLEQVYDVKVLRGSLDIDNLYVIYRQIPQNAASSAYFEDLHDLSKWRALRLLSSTHHLPAIFWMVLAFGAIIVTYSALLFRTENKRLHVLMMGILAGLMSICLWFIIVVNNPFSGEVSVDPGDFKYVFQIIDTLPR